MSRSPWQHHWYARQSIMAGQARAMTPEEIADDWTRALTDTFGDLLDRMAEDRVVSPQVTRAVVRLDLYVDREVTG